MGSMNELKCAIGSRSHSRLGETCMVLRGSLTRETMRALARRLESAGARPIAMDAASIEFADPEALGEVAAWMTRVGINRIEVFNASPAFSGVVRRSGFDNRIALHDTAHVAVAA